MGRYWMYCGWRKNRKSTSCNFSDDFYIIFFERFITLSASTWKFFVEAYTTWGLNGTVSRNRTEGARTKKQTNLQFFGFLKPYLGTSHTWGPLIPGDSSYLGTPHIWRPLIPGDPSHQGTHHTWGPRTLEPLMSGDPSYLGTLNTWGLLVHGDLSYLRTPLTWGPLILQDSSYLCTPHTWGLLIPGHPFIWVALIPLGTTAWHILIVLCYRLKSAIMTYTRVFKGITDFAWASQCRVLQCLDTILV